MNFERYKHLRRLGHPDTEDVDMGRVFVFPKLDGTNASIWWWGCGSRNRELSAEADNHGFFAWVQQQDHIKTLLAQLNWTLFGEWLVPHTIKHYREEAWRRFWVFDVYSWALGRYLKYDEYSTILTANGIDVIPPMASIENPTTEQLYKLAEQNTFLMQDGAGPGEGIVLKNYEQGKMAKIVRNEFKERNAESFGMGAEDVNVDIVQLATPEFIRKEWAKVVNDLANEQGVVPDTAFIEANRGKLIPRFLSTLFYTFVDEEAWNICRKFRNPVVDFGRVSKLLTIKAKRVLEEVF